MCHNFRPIPIKNRNNGPQTPSNPENSYVASPEKYAAVGPPGFGVPKPCWQFSTARIVISLYHGDIYGGFKGGSNCWRVVEHAEKTGATS
jgi:hypothetical protein